MLSIPALLFVYLPLGLIVAAIKCFLSPMNIPANKPLERSREHALLFCVALSTVCGLPGLIALLIRIALSFTSPNTSQRIQDQPSKIALAELIGVVVGFGFLPLLTFGSRMPVEHPGYLITLFGAAAVPYMLCVLSALNRVQSRNVPHGFVRTVYVGLFPLMIFAVVFLPIVLIPLASFADIVPDLPLSLSLGVLVIAAESLASLYCARLAPSPAGQIVVRASSLPIANSSGISGGPR